MMIRSRSPLVYSLIVMYEVAYRPDLLIYFNLLIAENYPYGHYPLLKGSLHKFSFKAISWHVAISMKQANQGLISLP